MEIRSRDPRIFRILDANSNRALEGLRVVEEICRFVLEDQVLTLRVKKIRGEVGRAMKALEGPLGQRGLRTRRALADVGRKMFTKDEGRRSNIENIFRANMKRAQEAMRCLEEFSKLINPKSGQRFKLIRYELYELEKQLFPRISKYVKLDFDLYVVTDPRFKHAFPAKAKIVQLRDKRISKQEYFCLAKKFAPRVRRLGAVFILNDYWDFVNEIGADGVHLGQEDITHLPLKKIRKAIGEDKIIGISTHSLAQARRALKLGADYISVGPIFATPSKPGRPPLGLAILNRVVRYVKIPVVAIGGINRTNIDAVRRQGIRRVAMIRAARELV